MWRTLALLMVVGCGSEAMEPRGYPLPASGGSTGSGGASGGASGAGGGNGSGGSAFVPVSTSWSVQMVAVDWQCTGQMVLVFQEGGAADGSWNCAELQAMCSYRRTYLGQDWCIAFTGSAIGKLDPSLSISLSLSVDAVRAIPVTGTAAPDRIIGTATFADNRTASFTAVLR